MILLNTKDCNDTELSLRVSYGSKPLTSLPLTGYFQLILPFANKREKASHSIPSRGGVAILLAASY